MGVKWKTHLSHLRKKEEKMRWAQPNDGEVASKDLALMDLTRIRLRILLTLSERELLLQNPLSLLWRKLGRRH